MDMHCQMIMDEYRDALPTFETIRDIALKELRRLTDERGMVVSDVAGRIKTEDSLAGKLELKGEKYRTLSDITDIFGARVITFYADEVDVVAKLVESAFEIDWDNSVDKRATLDPDRFGYLSLHYICRIPEALYHDDENPDINEFRFEIQLRSVLQHVWATIYHDMGYKSDVPVARDFIREYNRIAGMLELADDEFVRIRDDVERYRERVRSSLEDQAALDAIQLDEVSYGEWLGSDPFEPLVQRIASINGAEIERSGCARFLATFIWLGKKTLGDLSRLLREGSDLAYEIAHRQMQGKDLDIFSSAVAVQNLCIADIYLGGGDEQRMRELLDRLQGERPYNEKQAARLMTMCREIVHK